MAGRRIPAPLAYLTKAILLASLPLVIYGGYKYGLYGLISTNPPAQFTYAGIALLYFVSSAPSRREMILTVAGGLVLLFAFSLLRPSDFAGETLVRYGAFVGIAGLIAMTGRAICARDKEPALETLARCLIFVVLGIMLGTMLELASQVRPMKFDLFLYSIDVRFGTALSFVIGRLIRAWSPFGQFEIVVYHSLPFAFAVLYAAHIRRGQRGPVDILTMMWVNAVVGYGLYFLYPAAGPLYAFGPAFPYAAPALRELTLQVVRLNAPPNAMPSLHMAGALLIWWNARHWKLGRKIALGYTVLTGMAAVGFGEHYFLDLVVAFPYALAIQAAVSKVPRRLPALAIGAVMTAAWFIALLFAAKQLAAAPLWMMWTLAAITAAVPLSANARLLAADPYVDEGAPAADTLQLAVAPDCG